MERFSHKLKRAALAAHDCLAVLACGCILAFAFAPNAHAYVDPSIITYTIQALAGMAVALSALAGVLFRRTRKALVKTLRIDENARKEIEPDVHRLDAQGRPMRADGGIALQGGPDAATGPKARHAPEPPSEERRLTRKYLRWPSRLWRALLACTLLVGTVLVATPAEMVAASSSSLVFGLEDVWQPLAFRAIPLIVAGTLVLSLFRGTAFDVVLMLVMVVGTCFYLQALFLNQGLPAADGTPLVLSEHVQATAMSCAVWLAVLVIAIVLLMRWRPLARGLGVFICVALLVMQGAGAGSLLANPAAGQDAAAMAMADLPKDEKPAVITQEGLFEVSPHDNVIVFVLDAFDVIDMDNLLYSHPDALGELTGFTYFKNSTGSSAPTRYGIPFLLTGSWPKADETWQHYLDNRYASTSFTDDILAQGRSIYIYTDTPGPGGTQYLSSRAVNIHPLNETETHVEATFNLEATIDMLYQMALYRDMPWVLKEPFWFYTEEVNQAAVSVDTYETSTDNAKRTGSNSPYVIDDAAYYSRLQARRLSVYDDGANGSLRFIHLFGAHQPYTMDASGSRTTAAVTVQDQCIGSLRIVGEYLRQMKELGVYDDATIIITADHGYWNWDDTIEKSEASWDMAGGPIMLAKPAGTTEQSAQPLAVSDVRTGHIDYPATVIAAVGGDSSKYGPTVFEANDPARIRYYYWPTHDGTRDLVIYEYAINGEARDWNAWTRTGVSWVYEGNASNPVK